jgi:hypothetical protein
MRLLLSGLRTVRHPIALEEILQPTTDAAGIVIYSSQEPITDLTEQAPDFACSMVMIDREHTLSGRMATDRTTSILRSKQGVVILETESIESFQSIRPRCTRAEPAIALAETRAATRVEIIAAATTVWKPRA